MPFEIPKGWVWTTLGEISNYGESTNVPVDKISRESWVLELEDIEKDSGRLIQRRVKADRKINGVRHSFSNGCILYSKLRTYLNKVLIADQSGYCTTEIIPITCNKGVMPEYLCQVLRSNYFVDYTISLGYGVKMPRLGTADAIKSMIPLPPIHEQARIVALINRLATYIELLEANKQDAIEVANKIKSKILDFAVQGKLISQDPSDEPAIELLKRLIPQYKTADNRHYENIPTGWQLAKIKDVFTINPKNKVDDDVDAGFVSMTMIDDGYRDSYQFEKKKWALIKNGFTHFKDGDIAVAKISPCLENRKSMILKNLPNGIGTGTTELHIFRSAIVDPKFALYFFKSDHFINQCVGTFNGVVGQQRVGKNIIEDIMFPLPPYKEQRRISEKITQIFMCLDKITAEL